MKRVKDLFSEIVNFIEQDPFHISCEDVEKKFGKTTCSLNRHLRNFKHPTVGRLIEDCKTQLQLKQALSGEYLTSKWEGGSLNSELDRVNRRIKDTYGYNANQCYRLNQLHDITVYIKNPKPYKEALLEALEHALRAKFKEHNVVASIAETVDISPERINKIWMESYQEPIHDFIQYLRVSWVRNTFLETGFNLKKLCGMSGSKTVCTIDRQHHKLYGKSIREYIRENRLTDSLVALNGELVYLVPGHRKIIGDAITEMVKEHRFSLSLLSEKTNFPLEQLEWVTSSIFLNNPYLLFKNIYLQTHGVNYEKARRLCTSRIGLPSN